VLPQSSLSIVPIIPIAFFTSCSSRYAMPSFYNVLCHATRRRHRTAVKLVTRFSDTHLHIEMSSRSSLTIWGFCSTSACSIEDDETFYEQPQRQLTQCLTPTVRAKGSNPLVCHPACGYSHVDRIPREPNLTGKSKGVSPKGQSERPWSKLIHIIADAWQ
jgi:hypothetical protein